MNKEAAKNDSNAAAELKEEEQLKPKLEPTPLPPRRISHMDPMDK